MHRAGLTLIFAILLSACASIGTPVVSEGSPAQATRAGGVYIVNKGDTLYSIAWRFGLDYKELAAANAIFSPYIIRPGQRIRLQGLRTTVPVAPKPATASASSKPKAVARPVAEASSSVGGKTPPKTQSQPQAKPAANGKVGPQRANATSTAAAKPAVVKAAPAKKAPVQPKSTKPWVWPLAQRPAVAFGNGSKGLDYRISQRVQVGSAGSGSVVYAGNGIAGFERLVIVKHASNLLSAYSFNGKVQVAEQQQVVPGQRLAEILPRPGVGQVLHFELRRNGTPINPGSVIR